MPSIVVATDGVVEQNKPPPPTFHLIFVTFLVSVLLTASTAYEGCTVNLPVQIYLEFQNESFHAHFGYYLGDAAASSIWAFTIASNGVTSLIAALLVPWVANRFGNRIGAFGFGGAVIFIGSALGAAAKFCCSFELMIISLNFTYGFGWTFGFGCGIAYLAECAPPHLRGNIGAYAAFGVNLGALLAFALGFDEVLGSERLWPVYWGIGAIPSAIALILCPFIWESPKRAFFFHSDGDRTRRLLTVFYGKDYHLDTVVDTPDADGDQWSGVLKSFEQEREQAPKFLPVYMLFTMPHLRQAAILITVIVIFNNTCGPSILANYSTAIYGTLGFTRTNANLMTLGMQLPMPLINSLAGYFVDRLGRRPLLIYGGFGTVLTLTLYVVFAAILHYTALSTSVVAWLAATSLLLNAWCSAVPLSVTSFLYAEVVPQYALGMMTMYALVAGNLCYIIVTQVFPPLQLAIDFWAILVLGALPTAGTLAYFWRNQQETRCKSTSEIVEFWMSEKSAGAGKGDIGNI